MSKSLRKVGFAIALMVGATPLLMSAPASALTMTECSAKFAADKAAAKAAGTEFTTKWNDYRKANCGADAAAATTPPAATTPTTKVKTTVPATTAVAAPAQTAAASGSFMKDCSTAWKAMKANNTTPAGMTWKQFVAAKCVVPASAAAPAAKPATAAATKPATAATAAAPATTASGSFMKDCSAAWKAMKTNNTTPAGMTWKQFVAAKCVVPGVAAPATPAVATKPATTATPVIVAPAEPSDKPDATPLATADKNGKPYTPGQMAAHQRIRECGNQWRALKAANKLPVGTKWPQFWSACNKQLKAAGQ